MSDREARTPTGVWLTFERRFGQIVGPMGAYYSMVKYFDGVNECEILMENTGFILLEDFFETE